MGDAKTKRMIRYMSIGLFLLSLTLRTFRVEPEFDNTDIGLYCFIFGWFGLIVGGAFTCWLANPFLILAWLLNFKYPKASLAFGGLAAFFSLLFLSFDKIMIDEAGNYGQIISLSIGYWIWLAASLVFFTGNIWRLIENKRSKK